MGRPITSRKRDMTYLVFFAVHIVTLLRKAPLSRLEVCRGVRLTEPVQWWI